MACRSSGTYTVEFFDVIPCPGKHWTDGAEICAWPNDLNGRVFEVPYCCDVGFECWHLTQDNWNIVILCQKIDEKMSLLVSYGEIGCTTNDCGSPFYNHLGFSSSYAEEEDARVPNMTSVAVQIDTATGKVKEHTDNGVIKVQEMSPNCGTSHSSGLDCSSLGACECTGYGGYATISWAA